MKAIYSRELKSYFHSMTGYLFIAFLVVFIGIYFLAYNLGSGYPYFSFALSGVLMVLLIGIPVLTMRSFADERKTRTDQLLLTAPVSIYQIVAGKFLSMVTVMAVPLLISLLCPLIIAMNGTGYLMTDYISILAFFLLGCVCISIGMFISSLTESQVIAAVGSFGLMLLLILWRDITGLLPTTAGGSLMGFLMLLAFACFVLFRLTNHWILTCSVGAVGAAGLLITYFINESMFDRALVDMLGTVDIVGIFSQVASGHILDISGVVVQLSVMVLFLFLTAQSIEKRRWS